MAKAMTPEQFFLITQVRAHTYGDDGYCDQTVIFDDYSTHEIVRRNPPGDIEEEEAHLRAVNMAYRLDSILCAEGMAQFRPRPRYETWEEYLRSVILSKQVNALRNEGVA